MEERLLTAAELAERLSVSEATVVAWVRQGRIPEIRATERTRRFAYGEVVDALRRRTGGEGTCKEDTA